MKNLEGSSVLLQYESSIVDIVDLNPSFATGTLRIAYPGWNKNRSHIGKDVFEKCAPTIAYCPVVANYDLETDKIGGHDVDFIKDKNGDIKMINITEPLGVVPQDASWYWETVGKGGDAKEYFTTQVILWKRQPVYESIKEKGIVSHSMEIKVNKGRLEDEGFVIEDFCFLALCLLGDDVQPCFENSALEVFTSFYYKERFIQMLEEAKTFSLATFAKLEKEPGNEDDNQFQKEDSSVEKLALLEKYNLRQEDLDFSIEELSLAELEIKLQEAFQLTIMERLDEIRTVLSAETYEDEWGYTYHRYGFVDVQGGEVIAYDRKDHCRLYGFPVTTAADAVSVDLAGKRRKKTAYVDFEDGAGETVLYAEQLVNEVATQMQNRYDELQKTYNALKVQYEEMEPQFNALKQEKAAFLAEQEKAQREEVFNSFDKELSGIEEYEALKDNGEISFDELREKCFALLGMKTAKFSKAAKEKDSVSLFQIKVPEKKTTDTGSYLDLFAMYGKQPIKSK